MPAKVYWNRTPLPPSRFMPLPLTAVRPEGWLREELQLHAEGLTGHLYAFWPDVGDDSGWLGGSGEAWERGPYYLDGLLPLAWLLEDERLKARVQRMIDWTLESQRPDGFFGPDNDDWWPRMVMLKALMQYHGATNDKRVPLFCLRYFRYQFEHLRERPLEGWGAARAGENMLVALWLYNLTGKRFLLELCRMLVAQGVDWTGWLTTFPLVRPMAKTYPWPALKDQVRAEGGDIRQFYTRQYHLTHVVNVAMGLKTPALQALIAGGYKHETAFRTGYEKLMKHHGVAIGMFTGDEHLAGPSPAQGTELCAVAELMFTLETLLWTSGDPFAGDVLEKLAFNALPAAMTADRKGHQYLQQVNQVECSLAQRAFYNNGPDANLYGLEPHFGCCTANMHQGFPKYAASLWMASADGGLAAMSYAPCTVRYRLNGVLVRLAVETDYPYGESVRIRVEHKTPCAFPLHLRIPEWAEGATLALPDGRILPCPAGEFLRVERTFAHGDILTLRLPMEVRVREWAYGSVSVERGPLLFGLEPECRFEQVRAHDFVPDWAVYAQSAWNYALLPDRGFEVAEDPEQPRNLTIKARGARLPSWTVRRHSAERPPRLPQVTEPPETITLKPYGQTALRIAQFPRGVYPEAGGAEGAEGIQG